MKIKVLDLRLMLVQFKKLLAVKCFFRINVRLTKIFNFSKSDVLRNASWNIRNKENTLVSGVLPDRAIYLVTAGMTFSTISISNNSGALVEQSKGATHYTDYGLGVASGFYNMFCISWVLPAIQNPRLGVGLEINICVKNVKAVQYLTTSENADISEA